MNGLDAEFERLIQAKLHQDADKLVNRVYDSVFGTGAEADEDE